MATLRRHVAQKTVEVTTSAATLDSLLGGDSVDAKTIRLRLQNLSKTADIGVGTADTVTAAGTATTSGWILEPRQSIVFEWPKVDLDLLYFKATADAMMKVWQETRG